MRISVVIPTCNPNADRFEQTLVALGSQSLRPEEWECLVVDNASATPVDEAWCSKIAGREVRVVREPQAGLSYARLAGLRSAAAEILVFCDDDNVFASGYIEAALEKMEKAPRMGVAGGKSLPRYLDPLPDWYVDGMAPLGCRDLGDDAMQHTAAEFLARRQYPEFSPIGAGMVFRKKAMESWADSVGKTGISDRKGKSLNSAGDCDMVLHALGAGYDAAYWPDLVLHHLIPASRVTKEYLGAISRAAFRDFIRVLDLHGIHPWPAISPGSKRLRAARSWFRGRAWSGPASWIRWQGAIGQFEGRASLLKRNSTVH